LFVTVVFDLYFINPKKRGGRYTRHLRSPEVTSCCLSANWQRFTSGFGMQGGLGYAPLVVRRENAALTYEPYTSIQPEESPPGGQERECSFNI